MQQKFFFFDIDGTLTDRATGQIVPTAVKAIEKLRAAGHFVALATGRAHYKARIFFDRYGFQNMVCSGGKGIVINGKLIENPPLNYDDALALYQQAKAAGYGVLVAKDDSQKVYTDDFTFYEQAGERLEPTTMIIDRDFFPNEPIYKLYITIGENQAKTLPAFDRLGWLQIEKRYIVVQHDAKAEGILRMLSIIGGDPLQTVVFGDDTNDLVMFLPKFTKVAMGNACDELKVKADIIAPNNTDDGIYRVCETQGWF